MTDLLASDAERQALATELIKGRERLGITQAQLASNSGISLSAIKGYESGRNLPGARELKHLCQALQLSPTVLLFGNESPFASQEEAAPAWRTEEKGLSVQRQRISFLAPLLSLDECTAVYSLIHSIALARHGEAKVRESLEAADFIASLAEIKRGEPFDPYLGRLVTQDPEVARAFLNALRDAASQAANLNPEKTEKVSKK